MYDSIIATIAALAAVLSLMYDIWKDRRHMKDEDSPRKEGVKKDNGR